MIKGEKKGKEEEKEGMRKEEEGSKLFRCFLEIDAD